MHKTAVGWAIGKLMQVMGMLLIIPLAIELYDRRDLSWIDRFLEPVAGGFVLAILLAVISGTLMVVAFKAGRNLQGIKEGYTTVTLGWFCLTLIGAIPLWVHFMSGDGSASVIESFTNAYFEIMSGFTTTGATVISDVESLPRSLQFLRALTHWLGGMGIITLAIAIFPAMGVSGYQMFRGEVPGPTKDRLQPRLAHTATILWGVYVLLSGAETLLLWVSGMGLFDAVCHTFATMATGGFSNSNSSIAGYNSDLIEWIVTIFMFFAGINFVLHFRALRGDLTSMVRNREFIFYASVIGIAIVITTSVLYFGGLASVDHASSHYRASEMTMTEFYKHWHQQNNQIQSLYDSFRVASFQIVAIVTTTGFATADFDLWPDFLRYMMVFLMFFGGCAGSTGGGMKIIRIMLLGKMASYELRKLTQPRLIAPIRVGNETIEQPRMINILSFVILFVGLFVLTAGLMTLFVPDLTTAVSCSIATIGNIGPGLAGIGAVENYNWIPIPGKWILIFSMLLGRLEIFTVLIVFRAATWRK